MEDAKLLAAGRAISRCLESAIIDDPAEWLRRVNSAEALHGRSPLTNVVSVLCAGAIIDSNRRANEH